MTVSDLRVAVLGITVVDENDVILDPAKVRSILGLRCVEKIGISQMANEGRYFWAHAVLSDKGVMRVASENESLEQRPVEVISLPLFDGELVIVNLGTELPINYVRIASRTLDYTYL